MLVGVDAGISSVFVARTCVQGKSLGSKAYFDLHDQMLDAQTHQTIRMVLQEFDPIGCRPLLEL
jgi:hypothetical protein